MPVAHRSRQIFLNHKHILCLDGVLHKRFGKILLLCENKKPEKLQTNYINSLIFKLQTNPCFHSFLNSSQIKFLNDFIAR